MHIELGDGERYSTKGIGTITFKRDSGSHLHLKDVMYVHGLKENLISGEVLACHGYDIVVSKGKSFMRHVPIGQVKHIRFRVKNLYKLEVEVCVALGRKSGEVYSWVVGELWHICMGHLHHGTLKIMQQITTGLPKCTLDQYDVCKGCTSGKYVKSTFKG